LPAACVELDAALSRRLNVSSLEVDALIVDQHLVTWRAGWTDRLRHDPGAVEAIEQCGLG
jgi:hypothetical protein